MAVKRGTGLRLPLAVLLCTVAMSVTLWRDTHDYRRVRTADLTVTPLAVPTPSSAGAIVLAGAWELSAADSRFRGFSAMVSPAEGRLRAYSDFGSWMEFTTPDRAGAPRHEFGDVWAKGGKLVNDIEAAAYDPASGTTWLALEYTNRLRRLSSDVTEAAPPAMATFSANGGAEAMARLPDGRFLVLAESGAALTPMRRTGLLFPTDPVLDDRALAFAFDPPAGYSPTDAAALPDGRVLILLRGLTLTGFPVFASKLVVADPAEIEAGEPWPWREVAHLPDLAPRENYEGLSVTPGEGGLVLWLISDANRSVWLQRTLLLKLVWKEGLRLPE